VRQFEEVVGALRHRADWEEALEKLERGEFVELKSPGEMRGGGGKSDEERLEELYAEVERLGVLHRARLLSYTATTLWAKHVNELEEKARAEAYAGMHTTVEHLKKQMRRVTGIDKEKIVGRRR
jgi:hypothetical protein